MIKKKTEETAETDYLNTRCKQGNTVLLLLSETIKKNKLFIYILHAELYKNKHDKSRFKKKL